MDRDPSSCANYAEISVSHWDWQLECDFVTQTLKCSVTLKAKTHKDGVAELVLDAHDLVVSSVVNACNGEKLSFQTESPRGKFGSPLHVSLPTGCEAKDSEVQVTITYETSPGCTAVQWLKPAQTAGKKHPYLFTQCQPIHARSMLPCQDTPSVKCTFSAQVTVPAELTALMSGERLGSEPHPSNPSKRVFRFQQTIPIPSYLTALVVGALESRRVGPRSHVWSEREVVDQAAWEFEETEQMLSAAEEVMGEYVWGQYDLLVLPPSFHYGGMENPCLTFVSPTTLAGDRSQTTVIAHEISHSWTGNLVTNCSWEHFWLNEGFTTFLERRIIGKLHGEKERHLHYLGGWKSLSDAVERFSADDKLHLSAMVPTLRGVHPDDAFSAIPYEKGSSFLFSLESLLGGPGSLDDFLKAYVAQFKFASITTDQWKDFFLKYFHKEEGAGVFREVDWDNWLYTPGVPAHKPSYDTTLADASKALAERWAVVEADESVCMSQFSGGDLDGMSSLAVQEYLNQLLGKPPLVIIVLQAMNKVYGLSKVQNSEIKFRWLRLCLRSKWEDCFALVTEFVTAQGRMKFVRPLYKELFSCTEEGRRVALSTFQANRQFYHVQAATQIEKDLGLTALQ